jgi:hypothetical protein
MVKGDFQENKLNYDIDTGLYKQCKVVFRSGIIKYSTDSSQHKHSLDQCEPDSSNPHLNIEATNMISGISREKPALDFTRRIDIAWSA